MYDNAKEITENTFQIMGPNKMSARGYFALSVTTAIVRADW